MGPPFGNNAFFDHGGRLGPTGGRRSVLLKTLGNGYRMEEDDWMIQDFFDYMDAIDAIISKKENTVVDMCTTDTKNKQSPDILSLEEFEDWLDSGSNDGFDIKFTTHDMAKVICFEFSVVTSSWTFLR